MITAIEHARYLSLGTKKRDGSYVYTPVWFAADQTGDAYYVFSAKDAGKVKRLRNFSDAKIAPCTVSGNMLAETLPVTAVLIEGDKDVNEAHRLLIKKYRWQMRVLDLLSRLSGKFHNRQFIKISDSQNNQSSP